MLKFFVLNTIICLIISLSACENKPTQKYIKAPLNPNGDSELALVMRNMFDEVYDLKKKLREGGDIDSIASYHESLYAPATEDGLEESKTYQETSTQSIWIYRTISGLSHEHIHDTSNKH